MTDLRVRAEGAAVERSEGSLLGAISLYAPVAYVGALVVRDGQTGGVGARIVLATLPLIVLRALSPAIDDLPVGPRRWSRATLALLAVAILPWLSRVDRPWVVAASSAAGALAGALGAHLLASVTGLGGIGAAPRGRRGAAPVVALFGLGAAQAAVHALSRSARVGTRQVELVLVVLIVLAVVVLVARGAAQHRLELGARERYDVLLIAAPWAFAALLASTVALSLPVPSAAAGVGASLAIAVLVALLTRDPIATFARVTAGWALLVFGVVAVEALALLPASAQGRLGVLLGAVLGASLLALTRLLLGRPPALAALSAAEAAAHATDERDLARAVLRGLRVLAGPSHDPRRSPTPRLLLVSPLREITLDAAGEPRTRTPRDADLDPDAPSEIARIVPTQLLELLAREPLGVLRAEVLRARQVRGADLRVALAWCEDQEAAAVVAASEGGDLEGLLVLPDGVDARHLGLREVRVLRAMADAVTTRVALAAALARANARAEHRERHARELEALLDRAQERAARAEHALAAASAPLAEPLGVGGYAPGSRAALDALDRRARERSHLCLSHAPGTDPVPWVARLHARSGATGPLHVVDAATVDGAEARFSATPSALALADGGTLLVLSSPRLAPSAVDALAHALAFREAHGVPVDVRVVLAIPSPRALAEGSALPPRFPDVVRERLVGVRIPPLVERIEDLRALSLDRLARLGLSLRGAPLGLAEDALAALIEHDWPGDEAELAAVLLDAAQRCTGDRVRRGDLGSPGFGAPSREA